MTSDGAGSAAASAALPTLEVDKLHALPSEQQELYLLTFASDLARHVSGLDGPAATAQQAAIKKELMTVIGLSSPQPTRVVRNNLSSCFVGILSKGDRKVLFETINELVELLSSTSTAKDSATKHAALHCLGSVFETAGDSAIGQAVNACSTIIKTFKSASGHTGFRAAIFRAFGSVCIRVGSSLDETVAREAWKLARQVASADKALLVQSAACWCIQKLARHTSFFDNSSDFNKIQVILLKVMESPSLAVRRAAAACLSDMYSKHFAASPAASSTKSKKTKSKAKTTNGTADMDEPQEADAASTATASDLSFGVIDILRQLTAHYCKPTTSNKGRAGTVMVCIGVFRALGEDVVKANYASIAKHLFSDLLNSPAVVHNRYRLLLTRKFVRVILSDYVGGKLFGESAQLEAAKFHVSLLKDYPQSDVPERPEPSKQAIIGALDALTTLFDSLGSAVSAMGDSARGALLQVIEHPSYSVQVHASRCLKHFVLACPSQILPSAAICMNSVDREVKQLSGPRRSPRKCVGYALGLVSSISASASQPLYGSVEVYSRVLALANSILKSSGGQDLRLSSIQIQVAYIMIGGLMSLGPSFVKTHLSQLMMLWRNALPKTSPSDNLAQRSQIEISFLAHVRECALGSVLAFLTFNGRLLTLDISRRLSAMMQNTINFCFEMPNKRTTEDLEKRLSSALQLQDYDLMVRRRVFQCYAKLFKMCPAEAMEEILQSKILSLATSSFADPESIQAASLNASISTASASSESIWELADNSGFGVTSLVQGLRISDPAAPKETATDHWLDQSNMDAQLERFIHSPFCDDFEHDALQLCTDKFPSSAPPLTTGVVDTALRLFAAILPYRSAKVQIGAIEQIMSLLALENSSQSSIREVSLNINVGAAIFFTLNNPIRDSTAGVTRSVEVEKAQQELLHRFIAHHDLPTRHLAAQGLGRLCKSAGSDFTAKEVTYLVDTIVSNPSPNVRSGCAIALGTIISQLGGMAAGLHMKTILGILLSLASDSHPVVHFWALDGISRIADATGLSFSGYVSSTLGKLAQLYFAESHGDESAALQTSNSELDMPSLAVIARCIDSMINVLGPDLQEMNKERNMILTLTYQFQTESSSYAASESLKCLQNLSMYAPGQISFSPYLKQLQSKINSDDPDLQRTALTGLYNTMRRGAEDVLQKADSRLEDQIWMVLHDARGEGLMRQIIRDWVEQSGISRIDLWIPRIQRVLTRVIPHKLQSAEAVSAVAPGPPAPDDDEHTIDEEVAGFAASAAKTAKDNPDRPSEASQELLRWQVRCTAMESLNDILSMVAKDVAVNEDSDHVTLLQPRVSEMIRLAFAASTAQIVELRIQGVQVIGRLLQIFGRVPDPDFPEATLLEQYQAQISSALTPAFASDSSPLLAAEAVGVCGSFISAGIVTNADRMGRVLRLLTSALEDFSRDKEAVAIGDLQGLSSNAQVMVKLAVFSAWAELQIGSLDQAYLKDIISPHLMKLTPLWLQALREYARLKFEPDISASATGGITTGSLDEIYAALSRETLLAFYQSSWLNFVDAIASLIDEDSDFVFDALDNKPANGVANGTPSKKVAEINYRDEPVAFFFVLFGISFEALVSRSGDETLVAQKRTMDVLQALRKITSPAVAGRAIYQDAVFTETMDLFDRLALTERAEVQGVLVDIAQNLCVAHPAGRRDDDDDEGPLSEDIEQLFELTRIIVLVISRHVPALSATSNAAQAQVSPESGPLITQCLTALVDCAEVFPSVIKSDLHACILNTYSGILASPACQESIVPAALPIFRRFMGALARNGASYETRDQLRSMLARVLSIIKHAHLRESAAAVPAERNSLLAGSIILSSCSRAFSPSDPLVGRFVTELADCLDNAMTTKVAAGLCRSLLLLPTLSANPSVTDTHISTDLFDRLLAFVTVDAQVEGTVEARSVVANSLVAFCAALAKPHRTAALFVVLPALLQRAEKEEGTWAETGPLFLELAKRDPDGFRATVASLKPQDRSLLEGILKKSGAMGSSSGRRTERDAGPAEPSIALKMDF